MQFQCIDAIACLTNWCTLDPDFYEARAIVFSKMGQHRQALEIYVFKLEDYTKAEEYVQNLFHLTLKESQLIRQYRYCNHVHKTEEDTAAAEAELEQSSIHLVLLSLYLTPPHGYKAQYGPALEILAKHGSRLPPNSALEMIPESFPVKELDFYFKGRMRAANSRHNELRVTANLQKVQNIKTQAQLLVGEGVDPRFSRSRHVTVIEERLCGICHKRLGGSVINVFPE